MPERVWNGMTSARVRLTRCDDVDSRGRYASVAPRPSARKDGRLRGIVYTMILLLSSLALVLGHHFFYRYLDGKSIDPDAAELPTFLQKQNNVKRIGTAIAHGSRILLSTAIGVTFVQHFWETLRSRSLAISQIDALIHSGRSPFNQTALQAAKTSFTLFSISIVASLTALSVVLTPGSLTVSTEVERQTRCLVPSVPQDITSSNLSAYDSTTAALGGMISSNSYLPPFRMNEVVNCGRGASSCSYNVSFVGPAVDCKDITDETDFSSLLDPSPQDLNYLTDGIVVPTNAPYLIWNSSVFVGYSSGIGVTIQSRDLLQGTLQAANCSMFIATYDVGVRLESASSSIHVWNTNWYSEVYDVTFLDNYAAMGITMFGEVIFAGPDAYTFVARSAVSSGYGSLGYSSFFATTPTGNHTFTDTISHFVETFIQNASISMLSGNIFYGVSNDTATNLQTVTTTCSSTVTAYMYNSKRLLSTYGILLGFAALLTAYGCWIISRKGAEQKLLFSGVVRIGLNEELISLSLKSGIEGQTVAHLKSTSGALEELHPEPYIRDEGDAKDELISELTEEEKCDGHVLQPIPRRRQRFTGICFRVLLLVLAALGFMALNHAYFNYLSGKSPTPFQLSNPATSLLNQTISSDIGIGLSYAAQVLLAAAITISSVQLFWRAARSRGHSITQIDQLMTMQAVSFPSSPLRAFCTSLGVSVCALLAASTSLVSVLPSGSLSILTNYTREEACTVLVARNLSALETTSSDFTSPVTAVMMSGTYLQPSSTCNLGDSVSSCSYRLQFDGPGFNCEDVSASTNATEFIGRLVYQAAITPQTVNDLTMRVNVQAWDAERSTYQAVNCTGVSRRYSVTVSSGANSPSIMDVTESESESVIHANTSQLSTFAEAYLFSILELLETRFVFFELGVVQFGMTSSRLNSIALPVTFPFSGGGLGSLGSFALDGNVSVAGNLSLAVEGIAQNATLSLLSGTIFAINPDNPSPLENTSTTCTYSLTAYEYTPRTLLLTYGIAIFLTTLCAFSGWVAMRRNGVEETMDFSRFLRAVMNEKLYSVKNSLDMDTKLKADDTADGNFTPSLS
ncbi:hypothetical protein SCHPADRAFT_941027 [Schizopora paradoxa]|uniref:Uncharacterized protein n=1 Tax=Schizopora paradoxa TaxID=27342 RepID=A0A0H2RM19_9AGAM|nr:hypothetical protein SCHPADRAFT_941027 [Schizopora paradoxa]